MRFCNPGGNVPLRYHKDPEKSAATFVTATNGRRYSIPGDFAVVEEDGTMTLLGATVVIASVAAVVRRGSAARTADP